jgi:alpha-galactosidase
MRAGTAMMGHMGVELNLLAEPEADLSELKAAISLHKQHRALIHHGNFQRLDTPDFLNVVGVVAGDQSEALWSVAFLKGHAKTLPDRLYPVGLDADRLYCVKLVWPQNWRSLSSPSVVEALTLLGDGATLPGEALMTIGVQLPLTTPETVLLFHLKAEA